jgi:hypothetical protein
MTSPLDLAHIRNHLYQKGEKWWLVSIAISVITLFLALAAQWIGSRAWLNLSGVFALLAPVAITWTREAASINLSHPCERRRPDLLQL